MKKLINAIVVNYNYTKEIILISLALILLFVIILTTIIILIKSNNKKKIKIKNEITKEEIIKKTNQNKSKCTNCGATYFYDEIEKCPYCDK